MIGNLAYRATRPIGLVVVVAAVVLAGCTAGPSTGSVGPNAPGPAIAAAAVRLVSFDTCDQALRDLQSAAEPHVGPYGLQPGWNHMVQMDMEVNPGADAGAGPPMDGDAPVAEAPAAADGGRALAPEAAAELSAGAADQAAPQYSRTNVHEAGVDEADLVKTDGRRLVTVQRGLLRVVDLERRQVTGTLELSGASEQMVLSGDRVLVVGHGAPEPAMLRDSPPIGPTRLAPEEVELLLVDIAGRPRVAERLTVEGSYVDARLVGSTAQIVLRSTPQVPTVYPDGSGSEDAAREANLAALRQTQIDDWLPAFVHRRGGGGEERGRLVDCSDVRHPEVYSGASMLNVLTVDLTAGLKPVDAVSVLGDGQTVYATGESLYIADGRRWWSEDDSGTNIHKFGVSDSGSPEYRASGSVDGWLLNQYSMSEHEGRLRVATTTDEARRPLDDGFAPDPEPRLPATESQIVVLAERDGSLETVGSVGGLGKGERIYAVRFMGPVGYVVTFRETDPLYTVDLSDPADPRVVGELKIPGYSAYLHPAEDDRLIGVGQDATEQGRTVGTQLSLFDVADLAAPERTDTYGLPDSWSEVEHDPHAFLYWPADDLVVVPVQRHDAAEPLPMPDRDGAAVDPWLPPPGEAVVLRLEGDRFAELGVVQHPVPESRSHDPGWYEATIRRSLVVGDTLWTVSAAGVMGHDVQDLSERAWVPFDLP